MVVSKLTETKYFIALADGMGHGECANRISSMVLSRVKSMFEIGIDDELIEKYITELDVSDIDAIIKNLEKKKNCVICPCIFCLDC